MRRINIGKIVLVAAVLPLGCTPLTSPLDLAGTYSLKSVNSFPVPYAFPAAGASSVIALDDEFTLNPSGTYSELGHEQVSNGGAVSIAVLIDAGTFTRRNSVVTMESPLVGDRPASIEGGTFTVVQNGLTLVYQK